MTRITIAELAAVWDGPRKVTARLDPRTGQVLEIDRDADEAVSEIIREAVNNAFRHGAAERVWIDVSRQPSGEASLARRPSQASNRAAAELIEIIVTDDGRGRSEGSSPGLGSSLFDELCHSWSLADQDQGMSLRALVRAG